MANQRIDIDVGLKIDKTGLNQIKSSLQEIKNLTAQDLMKIGGHTDIQKAEQELKSLKSSISQIDGALEKAFNTDLGTLNVSKFNQALKGMNLNQVYKDFSAAGAAGQSAFRNVTSQILTTNMQLKQTHNFLNNMATTMANTVKWGVASSVMNSFTGSVQKAYGYVKSLDTSLNDIRIVTGQSAEAMDKFAVKANNAAKALGKSTTDYTKASLIYYQQGLSDEDVAARAETTLKAANVTGQSGEAVSEQLTAVWNGYKVSAEEAELYIDKLAAVAATTAADLEELSTGMSKVASAADLMGVDIDQLNAQMATIVSVTRQAPESVGTALKTIYARMGDIEAGLDAETTLGHYTEEMKAMGVNVLDANGKLRDMGSVIEEIGGKWQGMSREQQIALSQTMAGTRQYNNLLSLFDNWGMYTEALNTSANAAGTLQRQQDIYMESTQAHLNQLKAASEDLYDSLLDEGSINAFADGLTFVVQRLTDLVDGLGGGGNTLLALGSIGTKVFSQQIAQGLSTTIKNLQGVKHNAAQVSAQFEILRQFKDLSIGDKALTDIITWKEQIMQLGSIVTAEENNQANAIMKTRVELENEAAAWEQKKKAAEGFLNKSELSKGSITGISEKDGEKLNVILDAQIKKYGNAIEGSKRYSDSILNLKNAVADTSTSGEEYEKALSDVEAKMKTLKSSSEGILKTLDQQTVEYNELRNAIKEYNLALKTGDGEKIASAAEKMVGAYTNAARKMQQEARHTKGIVEQETNGATNNFKKKITESQETWHQFINNLNSTKKIQSIVNIVGSIGQLISVINTLSNIKDIMNDDSLTGAEKTLKVISALTMAIPMLSMALKSLKTDIGTLLVLTGLTTDAQLKEVGVSGALKAAWTAENSALKGLVKTLGVYALAIAAIAGTIYLIVKAYNKEKDALESATTAVQNQTEALDKLKNAQEDVNKSISAYEEARKKIDSLVEGTQEWRDATNEANAAVLELLDKYPELANEIDNVNGALKISETGLKNVQEWSSKAVNQAQSDLYLAKANKLDKENDYKTTEAGRNINYQIGNQQFTVDDATIDKVVSTINESGSGFLEEVESIQAELGTTNEELAEALHENRGDLAILAKEVAANTAAMQIYNQQAASGYLQDDEDYQNATESQKAIIDKIAGSKLQTETDKLYEQTYKDGAGKSDKEIQQEYAKLIGVDPTQTRNKGKNIGEYFIDGEWQKISDETARMALAAAEASGSLEGLSKGVVEASESIGKIDGMTEDIHNAALGFANGDTADLSGLSTSELEQLSNTNFTDEIAKQLGFEGENPAVDYMAAIDEAISQELENRKNKLQEELDNAPNTIAENLNGMMSKAELETFNNAGGIDMSAIDIESLNSMIKEGLSLEDVFNEIDWSSIDPSKPTEWFKNAFEQAVGDATYAKENEESVEGNYSKHAEEFGIDEEAYRNTTELIQDMAKESKELDNALEDQEDTAQEVAKDLLRYDKAVESVKENSEDWLKALKSGNLQDIGESMEDITNAYGNLLDIDASNLSDDFLTSTKNMELMQKAANGSEEAYNQLAEAARQDMAAKVGFDDSNFQAGFNDLMDKYHQGQSLEDLQVGANLDTGDFLNELTNMVNAAGMTAEEATDYLSSMGIDAEVETDTVSTPEMSTVITGYKPRIAWNSSSFNIGPASFDFKVPSLQFDTITEQVPTGKEIAANSLKVTSAKKSSGGGFKHKNSSHGSGNKGGGKKGGGGGGGGGGNTPTKSYKRTEQTKDRYHDINNEIAKLTNELDKLNKQQERLFGTELLHNLNKQLKVIEKQVTKTKEKLALARAEAKEMRTKQKKNQEPGYYNDLLDFGVKFNSDGEITNALSLMEKWDKAVQDLHDKWNAMSAKDQESEAGKKLEEEIKKAEENRDMLHSLIENYDELIYNTIPGLESEIQEQANLQLEIKLKVFNLEAELRLDLTEAYKQWNDFKQDLLDTKFFEDFEDTSGLVSAEAKKLLESSKLFQTEYEKMTTSGLTETLTDDVNELIKEMKDIEANPETYSGQFAARDSEGNILKEDGKVVINKNALLDALNTSMEELENHLLDVKQIQKELFDNLLESIDLIQESYEDQYETLEFVGDQIDYNLSMMELMGSEDYAKMAEYYAESAAYAEKMTATTKEAMDFYQKQMERDDITEEEREKFRELYMQAANDFQEALAEEAKIVQAQFENAVKQQAKTIRDLLGTDKAEMKWELAMDKDDDYLDSVEAAFGRQSFINKVQEKLNETDSLSAQKKLNSLLDDELKKLEEKGKLTQYDLDRANQMLEIELKRIALEEAQQNKSKMRLRRDSSGNYSYQFVADEEAQANAQQELLDAQKSLYDMDKDELQNKNQEILDVARELEESMLEYASLGEEQRALLHDEYQARWEYLKERQKELAGEAEHIQVNLAQSTFDSMKMLYDQDEANFSNLTAAELELLNGKHTTYKELSTEEQNIVKNQMVPTWTTALQTMIDAINNDDPEKGFEAAWKKAVDNITAANKACSDKLSTLKTTADTSYKTAKEKADEWLTKQKAVTSEVIATTEEVRKAKTAVDNLATAWEGVFNNALDALEKAEEYKEYITKLEADKVKEEQQPKKEEPKKEEPKKEEPQGSLKVGEDITYKGKYYYDSYGTSPAGSKGSEVKNAVVIDKIVSNPKSGQDWYVHIKGNPAKSSYKGYTDLGWIKKSQITAYQTGGYTGDWGGNDGKMAMLHKKELILNAKDTENILATVNIVRDMDSMINSLNDSIFARTNGMVNALNAIGLNFNTPGNELSQQVSIEANFPNVSSRIEIEQAFENLVNMASQYAYNTRR